MKALFTLSLLAIAATAQAASPYNTSTPPETYTLRDIKGSCPVTVKKTMVERGADRYLQLTGFNLTLDLSDRNKLEMVPVVFETSPIGGSVYRTYRGSSTECGPLAKYACPEGKTLGQNELYNWSWNDGLMYVKYTRDIYYIAAQGFFQNDKVTLAHDEGECVYRKVK